MGNPAQCYRVSPVIWDILTFYMTWKRTLTPSQQGWYLICLLRRDGRLSRPCSEIVCLSADSQLGNNQLTVSWWSWTHNLLMGSCYVTKPRSVTIILASEWMKSIRLTGLTELGGLPAEAQDWFASTSNSDCMSVTFVSVVSSGGRLNAYVTLALWPGRAAMHNYSAYSDQNCTVSKQTSKQ